MALLNLVYRDQLFPREPYRLAFEALRAAVPERQACRIMVGLLALAHDRRCEAELADCIAADLEAERLPDLAVLQAPLAPDPACVPQVTIQLASLDSYESLLDAVAESEERRGGQDFTSTCRSRRSPHHSKKK